MSVYADLPGHAGIVALTNLATLLPMFNGPCPEVACASTWSRRGLVSATNADSWAVPARFAVAVLLIRLVAPAR